MLTYTYQCEQCGEFEIRQGIADPRLSNCPECSGPVRRLIAGDTGFIMKGKSRSNSECGHATPCCGRAERCDVPPWWESSIAFSRLSAR
ncbi:FmdB family zinc ribbon protein [Myxococcota bacterium]